MQGLALVTGSESGSVDALGVGWENTGASTEAGRGAVCRALSQVILVSPSRHSMRWRQCRSRFPGQETEESGHQTRSVRPPNLPCPSPLGPHSLRSGLQLSSLT